MQEPLLEEYSVAAQIYKLSPAGTYHEADLVTAPSPTDQHFVSSDMCELARNSCAQSGFEMEIKRHWLGPDWYLPGREGNLIHKTNVPNLRADYRWLTLREEMDMVRSRLSSSRAVPSSRRKLMLLSTVQIELVKNDLSSRGPSKVSHELKPPGDAQSSSNGGPPSKAQEPLLTADNLGAAAMGAAPNSLKMPGMAAGSKLSAS